MSRSFYFHLTEKERLSNLPKFTQLLGNWVRLAPGPMLNDDIMILLCLLCFCTANSYCAF